MTPREMFDQSAGKTIAVIGDLIMDHYVNGEVKRLSPEAPICILSNPTTTQRLGGAGNVMLNLENLGLNVDLFCIHSKPDSLRQLSDSIYAHQGSHSIKTRYFCDNRQLLRVDDELPYENIEWNTFKQFSWWNYLQENFSLYNAIVFVDYHKGVVSDSLINGVMELAQHYRTPVIADAKYDFQRFAGASLIKCNAEEKSKSLPEDAMMNNWLKKNYIGYAVITKGKDGICLFSQEDFYAIDGYGVQNPDVCGAGDTVTAVLAMGMVTGYFNILSAVRLANIAAAEVCRHQGVHPIEKDELISALESSVQ